MVTGTRTPGPSLKRRLKKSVQAHGIYNQNLQAVPPTGSISYINHSAETSPAAAADFSALWSDLVGTL